MTEGERLLGHEDVVSWNARRFYVSGMDPSDVLQEAWSAALVAIRCYDPDGGRTERSWVGFCVDRWLATVLITSQREKRSAFRDRVSMSLVVVEGEAPLELQDALPSEWPETERVVLARDELLRVLSMPMSRLERSVLPYVLAETSYDEASAELGVGWKVFDNAVQRVRSKARACLEAA